MTGRAGPCDAVRCPLYGARHGLGVPNLTRERLQEGARELGQSEIAIPRRQIVHIAALPLLGSGNLDHVALRRIAEEGAA